jgi:serine/threonine protein kinase
MKRSNTEAIKAAREAFQSLGLEDWTESGGDLGAGGQATVFEVQRNDGTKGAFRCLKDKSPKAIKRFLREIRILTNPEFQHPSIMEILAHSDDENTPWYISKLGSPFFPYWKEQREKYRHAPEFLLNLAVNIVLQMLNGLAPLHDIGIVHRDIKPSNLIIDLSDGQHLPILIDFGLAYIEQEERLTSEDSAVGNIRFSPDIMMNRMDDIPPWLDVFQMSQLLMWLVSQKPTKNWGRPLDWRWANYSPSLSDDLVLSMRALTALCSEERTSPQNARELFGLINQLFVIEENGQEQPIDIEKAQRGISRGKSIQAVKLVEDVRIINSSYVAANRVYQHLRNKLESIYSDLLAASLPVRKTTDADFNSFYEHLMNHPRGNATTLYELECGEREAQKFHFRVHCFVYRPSLQSYISSPCLPESSNIFVFALQRYANLTRVTFPHRTKKLTLERTGEMMLRNEMMTDQEETTVSLVGQMIRSWLSDDDAWEVIQRDR